MATTKYASNVFINCPFDEQYSSLRNAMVFAIFDCGFIPRSALEEDDGGNVRVEKIKSIIEESKFGLHDISCTELDERNQLPRFNMPLELGVFIGAKTFGDKKQRNKNCLILDREPYRYQMFISDISGQDVKSHDGDTDTLISVVRDWLNDASGRKTIPGGRRIRQRYEQFWAQLPDICQEAQLDLDELTFNDYSLFVSEWLKQVSSAEA